MTLIPPKPKKPIDQLKLALQLMASQAAKTGNRLIGRENMVKTAKKTQVMTRLAIVEADALIASHNEIGTVNPAYPAELQPRDRARTGSIEQVQKIANDIDHESLGRSGRADSGAPIIGDDMVVESGNGRTIALKLAYATGKAEQYREWLISEAEYFGMTAEQIERFSEPVLVRIRQTDIDRKQFTIEANQDDKLAYSATERAKTDAGRISGALLDMFDVGDSGDLLATSNLKFIQAFLKELGSDEAAQYITSDGKPTQGLVTRIKAALFSKAYNDDRLLEMMADQTKPDLQNVLNALSVAAPRFIEAKAVSKSIEGHIEDLSTKMVDGIEASLDERIVSAIIDATNVISRAKQNDQNIAEYVSQQGLFEELPEGVGELAIFIANNARSAKKLSIAFKAMAEFSQNTNIENQNFGLFGEPEPVKLIDALNYANSKLEIEYGDNATIGLFDNLSIFDQIGIRNAKAMGQRYYLHSDIDKLAHAAATSPYNDLPEPTEQQKISGDYHKGDIALMGFNIKIENPAGSNRSGTDTNGNQWHSHMHHHYGYIDGSIGADGEELDIFIKSGTSSNWEGQIYVVDQINSDQSFDEHKVIFGADNANDARAIYLSNYEKGWTGLGAMVQLSHDQFSTWFNGNEPKTEKISSLFIEDVQATFDDINSFVQQAVQNEPNSEIQKLKTCLYLLALKNELVEHTTKRGKQLDGFILNGVKIADTKDFDKYSFFKNGGVFLRINTIELVPNSLLNEDQIIIKEVLKNVSDTNGNTEPTSTIRNQSGSGTSAGNGQSDIDQLARQSVEPTSSEGDQRNSDTSLPKNDAASVGSASNNTNAGGEKRSFIDDDSTANDSSRSGQFNGAGSRTKQRRNRAIIQDAKSTRSSLDAKVELQATANKYALDGTQPHEWGDIENIHESLPYLMKEQRDDVLKAEKHLIEKNANGILFTNGTGTGKTFTGLGAVRRFMNAGKTNILIVTLNDKIVKDFVKSGKAMGIDIHQLTGTNDNGEGVNNIVTTTYANFGQNDLLGKKDWDLIIIDEAHTLSQNANGDTTGSLEKLRALTGHHSGFYEWARMRYSEQYPEKDQDGKQSDEQIAEWYKLIEPKKKEWQDNWKKQAGNRAKVVFLSATPFSYVKTIDWAEGYLFDFEKPESLYGSDSQAEGLRYNSGNQREKFYMQNFGFRMRYNKLTQPDGKVDSGVMERMFAEKLKETGALTGRDLELSFDYDRKFVLIKSKAGEQIDEGLSYISDTKDKDDKQQYSTLSRLIHKRFDYLSRRKLLEAIKAEACIEQVKKHLALGRKVVIFHDYNEGGGFAPFMFSDIDFKRLDDSEQGVKAEYEVLERQRPDLVDLSFDYDAPINTLRRAFPKAVLFNGRVSKGQRQQNIDLFNQDNSGVDVMVVQSDAGSTGISMHDTTGTHQRVIINIGQPTKPAKLRQTEGRIFRVGQASNAIHRYLTTGTAWERAAFADTIAGRAETVDNLAKGDDAIVSIKNALIQAYEDAEYFEPSALDGIGGKAYDDENARVAKLSPFDKALTYYYAKGKRTESRNNREGKEWYATPEPLGMKMVEWAGVHKGDKVLEPSAGDGAIGRFVPDSAELTMIEPTESLASRAKMANTGANVINDSFESLDVGTKYNAIVMNPPFGNAGAMAIAHIRKAFSHLYDGGRIVALIPKGAMDSKVEQFLSDTKEAYLAGSFDLPQSTFKNAGTGVITRVILIEKHADAKDAPYPRNLDFSNAASPEELFERIRDISVKPRKLRIDEALEEYGLYVRTERSRFVYNGEGLNDSLINRIVMSSGFDTEKNEYGEISMRYNRSANIIKNLIERQANKVGIPT